MARNIKTRRQHHQRHAVRASGLRIPIPVQDLGEACSRRDEEGDACRESEIVNLGICVYYAPHSNVGAPIRRYK